MTMLARTTSLSIGGKAGQSGGNKKGGDRYTLIGRSRAGEGTSFAIPELKWFFDVGALVQGWKPKLIFLTHTHSDHVHVLTQMKNDENPPVICLPVEAEKFVKAHMVAHQEMCDCSTQSESQHENGGTYPIDYVLRTTAPGELITFRQSGIEYVVRPLKMEHRIPCLGYSIFKIKKGGLKEEYVGLPGPEIGRLRKEGVEVAASFEEPLVCFLGDTTAQAFETHPEILTQHHTIVVECSFIDEKNLSRAETTKHMHWDHLKPIVESNPHVLFVLIHFSLKYSTLELRDFFCEEQKSIRNIHPMLVEDEVIKQWEIRKVRRMKEDSSKSDGNVEVVEDDGPPRCKCQVCEP